MSKYHAKKAACSHGHTHDSKKEARRCDELHVLERKGAIWDLRVQVKIQLLPPCRFSEIDTRMTDERGLHYIADFQYIQMRDGKPVTVTVDVKGYHAAEYIIKRKLVKAMYCKDGNCVFIET